MIEKVLIVDDEPLAREFLSEFLAEKGAVVTTAADAQEAFSRIAEGEFDLVITDLRMPGDDGLALLRRIRLSGRDVPVVVNTAYGSVDSAVRALKEGAFDFLTKPLRPELVEQVLDNVAKAIADTKTHPRETELPCAGGTALSVPIIGRSQKLRSLVDTAIRVARSRATVLITGESGTGKELFARLIHKESPRRTKPFVRVNCAAFAETLLESELFGHERGSFTGAVARRDGRFELADGGTLFLDEIGETHPRDAGQAPALPRRSASSSESAATKTHQGRRPRDRGDQPRPLAAREIAAARFREDLYYRLNVVSIASLRCACGASDVAAPRDALPPRSTARRTDGTSARLQRRSACDRLRECRWPGNVRELENAIERAIVLEPGEILEARHLFNDGGSVASGGAVPGTPDVSAHVGCTLENVERALILRTLESTGNRRKEAALILGVTPRTLTNKIALFRREGIAVGAPLRARMHRIETQEV
jgi:DNA-binding NtrC family response regulator